MLYELSTGNNVVETLSWDAANQTLYAATSCERLDRLGRLEGYRAVKVKCKTEQSRAPVCNASNTSAKVDSEEGDDEEMGEGSSDKASDDEEIGVGSGGGPQEWDFTGFGDSGTYEEDDMGRAWPNIAWHSEDSFGALFDAGSHRLSKLRPRTALFWATNDHGHSPVCLQRKR